MAKERGWWKITKGNLLVSHKKGSFTSYVWVLGITVEPDEVDLEHVFQMIEEGYVEGEICKSE